eukprot:4907525-Prymnesium_polylepis.1
MARRRGSTWRITRPYALGLLSCYSSAALCVGGVGGYLRNGFVGPCKRPDWDQLLCTNHATLSAGRVTGSGCERWMLTHQHRCARAFPEI